MPRNLLNAILATTLCVGATAAQAQVIESRPQGIEGVGVDEKRGDQIPLDIRFRNSEGEWVTLGDLFDGSRPVLLSLNYSDCPMLCRVQLTGVLEALKEMEFSAGQDFDIVSVSIDPNEMPKQAKKTKAMYVGQYNRPGGEQGWRFYTGNQEDITRLADAVGFRYKYLPDRREYSHTAALMVCTPDGIVSRYLYGVAFEPATIRLSLVEAGEGKIGSAMDQILLFCFHYDETKGRYGPMARNIMTAGAMLTVVTLSACLLPFWLHRRVIRQAAPIQTAPIQTAPNNERPPHSGTPLDHEAT